jgi:transcriptional regulator with XRE-family HTH domain
MHNDLIKVNPKVLEWARKKACFSQSLLARKIGVSIQKYLDWLSGRSSPNMGELCKIALQLRCPVLIFLCMGVLE